MEDHANLNTMENLTAEIMRFHKCLPLRPDINEVIKAKTLVKVVEKDKESRTEAISKQGKSRGVSQELFNIFMEMQKSLVFYQGMERKREALKLLELENLHVLFDDFIQKASKCISPPSLTNLEFSNGSASTFSSSNLSPSTCSVASSGPFNPSGRINSTTSYFTGKESIKTSGVFSKDDSFVQTRSPFFSDTKLRTSDSSRDTDISLVEDEKDKLSFMKLAELIEMSSKKGVRELNLQNKLSNGVHRLPESFRKLSGLTTLDLSKNQLVDLPCAIMRLSSLIKLDLHENRIEELSEDFCHLMNLIFLDLRSNQLKSLPGTFCKLVHLEELRLCSNRLAALPESIGSLIKLKILTVETNDIEEIPHSIGYCSSLREIRADYNRLKALPEAIGRIETLEILSVRYNNIKQLPTTMSSLVRLRELDVSFNELESIPESLCFATSLVKMNLSGNFADLKSLPRSIGNLEMLEELDISNNQIRVLPESFRLLTRLRILRADENPMDVPPRHIVENGAKAVVSYMADLVSTSDIKMQQPGKRDKGLSWIRPRFSLLNLKKKKATDYVKAQY